MPFFTSPIRRENCNCLREGNRIQCWFDRSNIKCPFDAKWTQKQNSLKTNTWGKMVLRQKIKANISLKEDSDGISCKLWPGCMCYRMTREHHWCASVRGVCGSYRESWAITATADKATIHPYSALSLPWGPGLRRLSAVVSSVNQHLTYGEGGVWKCYF
jgi:hypothetical protein